MNTRPSQPSGEASRLAVLGVLSLAPNHGYGLRAILESWEVHRWLDIKYGSIYAALKRFQDSGLVETVGVDSKRGPARTTYRLTAAGERELADMLRTAWLQPPRWSLTTDLALMFLTLDWLGTSILEREELRSLLTERIANLEAAIENLAETAGQTIERVTLPALQALQRGHFDHGLALLRAELDWSRSIADALDAGSFDLPAPG